MPQRHAFPHTPVGLPRRALCVAAAAVALLSLAPNGAMAQATGHAPHGATGTRASGAAGQPATAAATPDQRFLRQLADYYENLRTQAHTGMMAPAGHAAHGAASDPAALDADIDARQREALQLLTTLYRDAYSPRATPDSGRAAAERGSQPAMSSMPSMPGMGMNTADSGAAHGGAEASPLAPEFRRGVALIDAARGRLRRPEVRALAVRHRALLRKQLGEPTPTPSARPSSR